MDLVRDVFDPVYQKILEKRGDLVGKQKTPTHGFENWLTVQLKSALKDTKLRPVSHSRGPDITFADGSTLELKAAANFSVPIGDGGNPSPSGEEKFWRNGHVSGHEPNFLNVQSFSRLQVDEELIKMVVSKQFSRSLFHHEPLAL